MSSMDNNVEAALEQLIDSILNSEIYGEYDKQRIRVDEYPELKAQIDEFRSRNYELQTNENTTIEQIDSFEQEYAEFREQPLVADFLAAELAFCRLMQDVELHLTDAMHFE